MSRHAELEELASAQAAEQTAAIELEAAVEAALSAAQQARTDLVEAHAAGRQITKAHTRRDEADRKVEELSIRAEAAQLRATRAAQERERFEVEHARELIEELVPDAQAAIEKMRAAATDLLAADRDWYAVSHRSGHFLSKIAGATAAQNSPGDHGLAPIVRDLRRALAGVAHRSQSSRFRDRA